MGRDTLFRLRPVAACLAAFLAASCGRADTSPNQTPAQAQKVATAYIDAYNDRNVDRLSEIIASSVAYGGEDSDRDRFLTAIEGFWEAFPDITLEPTHIIADEEWAAIRIEFSGTHEGEFAGFEPTGEPVEGSEIMLFRIRDGQITEYWYEWDERGFYEQLGAEERGED